MDGIEYIQVLNNEMMPFDIGKVLRIHARTSKNETYYRLYDSEGGAYLASATKLISKQVYDYLATKIPYSLFLDTPCLDENDPISMDNYNYANEMFIKEWDVENDLKLVLNFKIKDINNVSDFNAKLEITKGLDSKKGNYKASYKFNGKTKKLYFSSLGVAKSECKEFILNDLYGFHYNKLTTFN